MVSENVTSTLNPIPAVPAGEGVRKRGGERQGSGRPHPRARAGRGVLRRQRRAGGSRWPLLMNPSAHTPK